MAVTLTKGQRISLDKIAPGLTEVFVGLGWDVKAMDTGLDFDLDASVLGASHFCKNGMLPKFI
jgi:tellurium resistance protein TerD